MYNKNNNKKMITAKKISAASKLEVLTAIRKVNFDCSDFEQTCEGDVLSSATCRKEIETENFNIAIELEETVRWSSYEDCDFEDMQLTDFIVYDEDGDNYGQNFTDEEILTTINY